MCDTTRSCGSAGRGVGGPFPLLADHTAYAIERGSVGEISRDLGMVAVIDAADSGREDRKPDSNAQEGTFVDLATLRRLVLRRLESDRRLGMTHLPRSAGSFDLSFLDDVAVREAAIQEKAALRAASVPAASAGVAPTVAGRAGVAGGGLPVPESIPTGKNITPPNTEVSRQPREERVKQLTVLSERVAGCVRCPELARTRNKTVFGVGNPEAAILFLGEAPGADEDRLGEPFVGKAGQLLDRIIAACRLTREEIYIANILKCRPPGNRTPTPVEAANCREYLTAQIATVDPDYIVCWGKTAVEHLLGTKAPLGKLRQQFFSYGRAKVAATYHPSYLLRNPNAKPDVWEDMKWLFQDMGIDLTAK